MVNVVNPTAGLFSGDRVDCQVTVRGGASLLLTSSSAQRIHRMETGEASLTQRFAVEKEGWMEVLPEILIPQAGSRFSQQTVISAESGAHVLYFETLAPGRVASGEVFRYARLNLGMDVSYAGVRVLHERSQIAMDSPSLCGLNTLFPASYFGHCLAIGPSFMVETGLETALSSLSGDGVFLGRSRLATGGWVVKMLARSAPDLRQAMRGARAILHAAANREMPDTRRL